MKRVGTIWHMLPQYGQCRKAVWDAVNPRTGKRRIDEAFPDEICEVKRNQDMFIRFINGSQWQLVGSDNYNALVGSPPVGLVFSEYALADPAAWGYLRPILAENGGWAVFISTTRGKNHLYSLYQMAKDDPHWFAEITTIEDSQLLSPEQLTRELAEYIATFGKEEGEALFRQEWYCFPKGTQIWTDKGQVPIEKIDLTSTVLTHAGRWRKVTKLFTHEYSGEFVRIVSAGSCEPLICTANHPVRVCDPRTQTYKWIAAGDVTTADFVVLPRLKLPKIPVIGQELATLIAWYIAEGSVAGNKVVFSLNKLETGFADTIVKAGSVFGKTQQLQTETSLVVSINSCWLADFLLVNCGGGAKNKRIPWGLIAGHEQHVYDILIDGDGCRGDYSGVAEVYTTISYTLALDVQMLAHMLGWRARVDKRAKETQSQTIMGRSVNISDSYSVRMAIKRPAQNTARKILPQKHGVATRVTKVEKWFAEEPVYNFSVQYDESYVAEGRVVHNCAWDGAVSGSYYGALITQAELDGRITRVPYDPQLQVITAWDLGVGDATGIWFLQVVGNEIRAIDYEEASGEGMPYYARLLKDKPYVYEQHIMPHDIRVRELGTGKSRYETCLALGIKPINIARSLPIDDGINAVRSILPRMYFDAKKCSLGIEHLRNYKKEYDNTRKEYKNKPLHGPESHASDALRMFAVGHQPTAKVKTVSSTMEKFNFSHVW